MIYTGKIEKHTEIQTDDSRANPRKNFGWMCSCGDGADGIETYAQAEGRLDAHMRQHWSKDNRPQTHAVIAIEGAPTYITKGSRVEVIEGSWMGKQGTVTLIDSGNSINERPPSSYVMVKFDGETGEKPVKACTLAPLDAPAHEDPQDAIQRPPTRDASHDVRHARPSSQGSPEHAPTTHPTLLVTFVDDPDFPGCTLGESKSIDSRWDLFTEEEIQLIDQFISSAGKSFNTEIEELLTEMRDNFRKR